MKEKLLVFSLLWGTGALWAQGPGGPPWDLPQGRWWDRPRLAQELGLTDEQKARLEEVASQRMRALIDARAAVQKAELELGLVADKEPFDARKVREAFFGLQQARQKLELERFEMLLAMRQVLTPEQWGKLRRLARERFQDRREERLRRRLEDRPGPGGPRL